MLQAKHNWDKFKPEEIVYTIVKDVICSACGGGYIKLFPPGLEPTRIDGDTEYNIMFGVSILVLFVNHMLMYTFKA